MTHQPAPSAELVSVALQATKAAGSVQMSRSLHANNPLGCGNASAAVLDSVAFLQQSLRNIEPGMHVSLQTTGALSFPLLSNPPGMGPILSDAAMTPVLEHHLCCSFFIPIHGYLCLGEVKVTDRDCA